MNNLYFLDFETGGLKSYIHGVCSCYISKYKDDYSKLFTFHPQKKIYEMGAFNVNGFDFKTLFEKGKSREALIYELQELADKHKQEGHIVIAGWNIMFDMEFLLNIFKEKQIKLPCPILAFDLKEIAEKNIKKKDGRKKEDDGIENHRLTTVYQWFFEDFNEELAHTAEYDVMMTEKLLDKFVELEWLRL